MFDWLFKKPGPESLIDEGERMRGKIEAYRNRCERRRIATIGSHEKIMSKLEKFPVGFSANMVEVAHAIDEPWIGTESAIRQLIRNKKWEMIDEKRDMVKRIE